MLLCPAGFVVLGYLQTASVPCSATDATVQLLLSKLAASACNRRVTQLCLQECDDMLRCLAICMSSVLKGVISKYHDGAWWLLLQMHHLCYYRGMALSVLTCCAYPTD
jgi:hypothetical protein